MTKQKTCTVKHRGLWCTLNQYHHGLHYDGHEKEYFENAAYPLEWLPERHIHFYNALRSVELEKGRRLTDDEVVVIFNRIAELVI